MIQNDESVNCLTVLHQERLDMQDKKLTPDLVPVIKNILTGPLSPWQQQMMERDLKDSLGN